MANILIVDDSLVDRRLARAILENGMECAIVEACSAEAAIEYLETVAVPDLILTDLQMPGLNGLELVERVREEWLSLPVILMTAAGSEDIASQALKVGAASYVPKKRLGNDLIPTVQRILDGARYEHTHSRLMHSLDRGELTFNLRNDVGLIAPLVRIVQEMLRSLPLKDETERLRVGVALEEAIKNAVYFGNLELDSAIDKGRTSDALAAERLYVSPYCNRNVSVVISVSRDEAVFTISDEGQGFDPSLFESDELNNDDPRGRGICLMRTLMDDVTFINNGRQVVLTKFRYTESEMADEAGECPVD
ncbi:MAG: response regulator [Planctomycetota bacterium]|nr:response regulator [Planctomycetota bacterium]